MLTRRGFLGSPAALALAGWARPEGKRGKLVEFGYSDVKLTSGPLAAMYSRMQTHFLRLDEDRLLKVYRQRAGMGAPGRDMGGWYDAEGFVPGHLIGQFISGLARMYATTGDEEAREKARRLTLGYAETFAKDGNPYASPKGSTTWPCYILDKYEIGLLDAAALAGVGEAKELLPRVIGAAQRFIPDHTYDRNADSPKQAPYDEPYILPENLFKTYALTGEKKFLDLAKLYLLDKEFFDPLARGENILPGKHGYSHVIALSSGAKAYEVLGEEKYLRAIRNAWEMIEQTQQYASGAWAPNETFVKPDSEELAGSLRTTRNHFETACCAYAHLKLARYLMAFTGEARYGDGLERVLLNTILGAIDPDEDGGYFYYSDYQAGARKGYYHRKWPCCAGTLLQSVADFPLNVYFHDAEGVYVNLYAGSEVGWRTSEGVPVKLTQRTAYPESEEIEIAVDPAAVAGFALHLRIPGWLEHPARMLVNGKAAGVKAEAGSFATLRRKWKQGDRVTLSLPFSFRTVAIEKKVPDLVAVMRGPVMLNAVEVGEELTAQAGALREMNPVGGKVLEFECRTAAGKVRMRPFYRIGKEMYSTYFRLG